MLSAALMPDAPPPLAAVLRLGDEIAAAVEGEQWARLPALVERRARAAERVAEKHATEQRAGGNALGAEQRDALAAQHKRLQALLRERRDQIEDELAQFSRAKTARDAYETSAPPRKVLHSRLSG